MNLLLKPLELPEPMTAINPDTWANDTVTRRWPEIAHRILVENTIKPIPTARIEQLIQDVQTGKIRNIDDPSAPDTGNWNDAIAAHIGQDWLTPPWFFSEHYFYRRIIEALGYFKPGIENAIDPFTLQKERGLAFSREAIRKLATRVNRWKAADVSRENLVKLLYIDLWGNQADLSMWPAEDDGKPNHDDLEGAKGYLLADDAEAVAAYILNFNRSEASQGKRNLGRVDFIIDNAGFELVCDLALCLYLLSTGAADEVCLHVKPHPTYVSDAMVKDVLATIKYLQTDKDPEVQAFGIQILSYFELGNLHIKDNFYWTSPLPGWEMPLPLVGDLSRSELVVSKGDANYRRLLGDLAWSETTPFGEILAYFPVPIVALRTVKAEIVCGLPDGKSAQLDALDSGWMINGRWGVVQFKR